MKWKLIDSALLYISVALVINVITGGFTQYFGEISIVAIFIFARVLDVLFEEKDKKKWK